MSVSQSFPISLIYCRLQDPAYYRHKMWHTLGQGTNLLQGNFGRKPEYPDENAHMHRENMELHS